MKNIHYYETLHIHPVSVTPHSILNDIGERIVNVGGTECACGGTHVKNTADIHGVTVTRIKKVPSSIIMAHI